jgi:hypothetical protein
LIGAILFAAAGCTGGGPDSATGPSGPTTTERFTGQVDVGGRGPVHNFTVNQSNGTLTLVVKQAGPPSDVFVGLALGSQTADGCVAITGAVTTVQPGATAPPAGLAGIASAGAYCFLVYDPGAPLTFANSITYSVDVTHY